MLVVVTLPAISTSDIQFKPGAKTCLSSYLSDGWEMAIVAPKLTRLNGDLGHTTQAIQQLFRQLPIVPIVYLATAPDTYVMLARDSDPYTTTNHAFLNDGYIKLLSRSNWNFQATGLFELALLNSLAHDSIDLVIGADMDDYHRVTDAACARRFVHGFSGINDSLYFDTKET